MSVCGHTFGGKGRKLQNLYYSRDLDVIRTTSVHESRTQTGLKLGLAFSGKVNFILINAYFDPNCIIICSAGKGLLCCVIQG